MTVEIICAVFNGARYLSDFAQSVRAQTYPHWRLWMRDDGSSDASVETLAALAATDPRIRVLGNEQPRLGIVGGFSVLLEQLPRDAEYIMFADQDDVWLPEKVERSLAAMSAAEGSARGPVLVHSDLIVVDESLVTIDRSFWRFAGINPEPPTLRRLIVRNVATGATTLFNRALRERVGTIPRDAAVHDWWVGCVASVFGQVVALETPTVLYRQHGANAIGARRPASALGVGDVMRGTPGAFRRSVRVRADIAKAALQARAFLDRYHDHLSPDDRRFLLAYSRIPGHGFFRRKIDIFRMQLRPENGIVQNVGILLRA